MRTASRIAVILLMLMGLSVAQDPPKEIPKLTDNAALQYWFAFYFMYDDQKDAGPKIPDPATWPKKLSELYPRYIEDPKVFFITPGEVPKDILLDQIDQSTDFQYSPSSLRKGGRYGLHTLCVLRTKRDDCFGPVRGRVEGYADGHVIWKPKTRGDKMPDTARTALVHAKQILLAIYSYQHDHEAERSIPKQAPSDFVYSNLIRGHVSASEARKRGIREVCERNKRAVTEYLRKGAAMTRCDFGLDYSRGLLILLPHLSKARTLARNAIAYGKLLEAEKMPLEAAQVYCDVLAMGRHVAQDQLLVSGLVGCAVEGMASNALRCLLAHNPPAEVCQLTLARLSALPDPYIEFGTRLPFEAGLVRPMLFAALAGEPGLTLSETEREQVRKMFRGEAGADAALLDSNDKEKTRKLLTMYYDEYVDRAAVAAEILGEPYPTAVLTLGEMHKQAQASANPVLKALLPDVTALARSQAKAQTQVYATRILAAAALHRDKTRRYPKTLDELAPYFPNGIPLDPMADKPFTYVLEKGKPCLQSAGEGGKKDEDYVFSFEQILRKERSGKRWTGR